MESKFNYNYLQPLSDLKKIVFTCGFALIINHLSDRKEAKVETSNYN